MVYTLSMPKPEPWQRAYPSSGRQARNSDILEPWTTDAQCLSVDLTPSLCLALSPSRIHDWRAELINLNLKSAIKQQLELLIMVGLSIMTGPLESSTRELLRGISKNKWGKCVFIHKLPQIRALNVEHIKLSPPVYLSRPQCLPTWLSQYHQLKWVQTAYARHGLQATYIQT
jgi:hypothetical protein